MQDGYTVGGHMGWHSVHTATRVHCVLYVQHQVHLIHGPQGGLGNLGLALMQVYTRTSAQSFSIQKEELRERGRRGGGGWHRVPIGS
jgi:hypothetical protein